MDAPEKHVPNVWDIYSLNSNKSPLGAKTNYINTCLHKMSLYVYFIEM